LFVGVCRLTLLAPQCHSLKEKRSVIRKIKDRTRARFHLSLSEVGAQNTWQRVVLGFALVGSERSVVENGLGDVVSFIEAMGLASMAEVQREILTYGDTPLAETVSGRGIASTPGRSGEPDVPGEPGAGGEPDHGDDIDDDWIPDSWKAMDAGDAAPPAGGVPTVRGRR
jgi:uncharacterized protein YlxP (DUF503 family)